MIDPDNPVVKLCAEGMGAETAGRHDDARALFERAWETRTDDFEACIAAHYLARQQPTLAETLRWNEISLEHADAVAGDRVRSFYPSLYLNLGRAHEVCGDVVQARRFYDLAAAKLDDLPDDGYGAMIRSGIENAHARLAAAEA